MDLQEIDVGNNRQRPSWATVRPSPSSFSTSASAAVQATVAHALRSGAPFSSPQGLGGGGSATPSFSASTTRIAPSFNSSLRSHNDSRHDDTRATPRAREHEDPRSLFHDETNDSLQLSPGGGLVASLSRRAQILASESPALAVSSNGQTPLRKPQWGNYGQVKALGDLTRIRAARRN